MLFLYSEAMALQENKYNSLIKYSTSSLKIITASSLFSGSLFGISLSGVLGATSFRGAPPDALT